MSANRILIRFNTKHAEDAEGRRWRVLLNGEESLAHSVVMHVRVETITEPIATGEVKDHFLAEGQVEWEPGFVAVVKPTEAAIV